MANQYSKRNNKKEIIWNVVNSLLAASLVFLGGLSTGHFSIGSLITAGVAGGIVALTKFAAYWQKEKKEYQSKIFNFVGGI